AVKKGVNLPLPKEMEAGMEDVAKRSGWNKTATGEFALPTEIWREVVARRQRYQQVRAKLAGGEVREINDFITLNLDLRQFAQDVLQNCEGPDLLMAFWQAITTITVLDPTGGSGAFIFAALNILEPLYEACLDRMEAFLAEWGDTGKKAHPNYHKKFTEVLARVDAHPNRRYFVLKSIILNNLYAVDIMEEAVEICKLRLFLKLAAQVEPDTGRDNLGIEPLPDIDFNIRAGNTLVGYATYEEVKRAVTSALDFDNAMEKISVKAADLQQTFDKFRQLQTEGDGSVPHTDKQELQKRLKALDDELNRHLAGEYGVKVSDKTAFDKWVKSHQPFHWFIHFYGILNNGGFDVIIGNPPYVVNTPEKVDYGIRESLYTTYPSKNLYAFVFERSVQLANRGAAVAMIVQLTALSAEKMSSLQDLLLRRGLLVASAFPRRPESIFDGVEMPVTILISRSSSPKLHTTRVNRFYTEERPSALDNMGFAQHDVRMHGHRIAKIGSPVGVGIYRKVESQKGILGSLTSSTSRDVLYYQEACRYWVKACVGMPFFRRNGERMSPPHGRTLYFRDAASCAFAGCLVNSSLFYWFYSLFSDCEHINDALIRDFRIPSVSGKDDWVGLEKRLAESQKRYARRKTILTKQGHKIEYDEMDAPQSKPILDEIDTVLAKHYGFGMEELDFILNYDIKYRLGRETDEADQ
ncbi:MAG: Eco57I restriction-modification methylase domain-containing protein, partial [Pseudolabrys sp.]|nr:Eco57I restriction-modification methylase domain-containing protein [Pseudolabrys sp.]